MPAALPQTAIATPRRRQSATVLQPVRIEAARELQARPDAEFPRRNSPLKVGALEPALAG